MEPLTKPRYFSKGISMAHIAVTALVIVLAVMVGVASSRHVARAIFVFFLYGIPLNIVVFIVGIILYAVRNNRYISERRHRETLDAIERSRKS